MAQLTELVSLFMCAPITWASSCFVVIRWQLSMNWCGISLKQPTVRGSRGERGGAQRRTISGVGQFGVLLALERHLVLAQLVTVHAAVCEGQRNATSHGRNWGARRQQADFPLLSEHNLLCKYDSQTVASSGKQITFQIFWWTGEGEICGSECRHFVLFPPPPPPPSPCCRVQFALRNWQKTALHITCSPLQSAVTFLFLNTTLSQRWAWQRYLCMIITSASVALLDNTPQLQRICEKNNTFHITEY